MKHYKCQTTGPEWWAIRDYLIESTDENFFLGLIPQERHYMFCSGFKSEYLDIKGVRDEGMPVVRANYLPAGNAAFVYGSLGTMFFSVVSESSNRDKILKAVKKALESLGFDVKDDEDSLQSNDLVINGEKVFGVARGKITEDRYVYSFFINLELDKGKLSYVNQPLAKFDGKMVETTEERVSSGLRSIRPDLTFDEVYNAVKEFVEKELDIKYEKGNLEEKDIDWDEVEKIKDKLTSDERVFKK